MARRTRTRRKKRTRRSPKSLINVSNLAETFLMGSVLTQLTMRNNLFQAVWPGAANVDKWGQFGGPENLTVGEIFRGSLSGMRDGISGTDKMGVWNQLWQNMTDPVELGKAIGMSIAIPVGFRLGKRLLRRPINAVNRGLKDVGLKSTIKV